MGFLQCKPVFLNRGGALSLSRSTRRIAHEDWQTDYRNAKILVTPWDRSYVCKGSCAPHPTALRADLMFAGVEILCTAAKIVKCHYRTLVTVLGEWRN